jgi:drug/metabolite transporter (DMT)-like permease
MEIMFVRMTVTVVLLLPFLLIGGYNVLGSDGDWKWLTMAGLSCAFEIALHYSAMRLMPYADVSAIIFSGFVLILFFAWIFLDESCGVFEILMSVITIIGIILVAHPDALVALFTGGEGHSSRRYDSFLSRLAGTGLSLLSCVCSVGLFLSARKVSHVHFSVMTFHTAVWGTITSAVMTSAFGEWRAPDSNLQWVYLFGVAVVGCISVVLVFQALRFEEAGAVSMVRTSEIPFSYILQIIFIDQYPNVYAACGATIISLTSISCGLRAWLRTRRKERDIYEELHGKNLVSGTKVNDVRDDDGYQSDCDDLENGSFKKCRGICCK